LKRTSRKSEKARSSPSGTRAPARETDATATAASDVYPVSSSNLSLHELFEQQARQMLERADIDEEQRQSILVAMACPCCGAAGMSFSVKLKAEES
jgi:hypothetical protein